MILIGMFVLVTLYWPMQASAATPEETLKAYLRAIYARDYGVAYYLISPADRKLKTEQEYVQQSGAFSGATGRNRNQRLATPMSRSSYP